MQKLLVILVLAVLVAPAIAYDDNEILAFARGAAASSGLNLKLNISITGQDKDTLSVVTNFGPILGTDTGLWTMTGDMLKVTENYPGRFNMLSVTSVNSRSQFLGQEIILLDNQGNPKSGD